MHQSQSSIKDKAISFHKKVARSQREQIFRRKREQLYNSQQEYPLESSCLEKYWSLSAREISLYHEEIFDTLDNISTDELSEQDNLALCTDLCYLLTSNPDFRLPYSFSFKKDGSPYSATVVAYSMSSLTDEEINYWLTYMDDDAKTVLYLNIQVEDNHFERWVNNQEFADEVVMDWGNLPEAEDLLLRMIEVADWKDNWEIFEQVWERLFQIKKHQPLNYTPSFFLILSQLIIFYLAVPSVRKKLDFVKIIFNEALIEIFNKDKSFDLGDQFVRTVDLMMEHARETATIIFGKQAFDSMCFILMENFYLKFVNTESDKYMKNTRSDQDFFKLKSKCIEGLINICVNYLRLSLLFGQNAKILEDLMVMINSERETGHQHLFNKLLNLNPTKTKKLQQNTLNKSDLQQQIFQKNENIEYQI